jgi:mannose-6-phosphate isomerase-like protein (cupin superfamily)
MPFGEPVVRLPQARLGGARVYVHDNGTGQVLFIEAPADGPDVVVATHTHGDEWGVVVEGEIEMTIDGRVEVHGPGTPHQIPAGVPHSFRFRPGTSSIHCFPERRVTLPAA